MEADDEIWKPGYDGPPPTPSPLAEKPQESRAEASPGGSPEESAVDASHRTGRRQLGAVVAVVAVAVVAAVAALVVFDPFADGGAEQDIAADAPTVEASDRSVFAGPEDRRLPRTATELWTLDLVDVDDHWVEVIGRELVVVASGSPEAAGSSLVALDALTGAQRWTRAVPGDPSEVAVIGAVDDLLVVEQPGESGPTVTGVDMATGEPRWSVDAGPNAGHVGLVGTRYIARLPSSPDRLIALIDATSGSEVGEVVSDPDADGRPGGWITDRRGTWYSIADGEALAFDLTSGFGAVTTVGELDAGPVPPVVVGDRLAAVDDTGSIVLVGPDGRQPATGSSVPSPVRSLTPVSGSEFVVTSPGSIAGVAVEGDDVSVAWRRDGGAEVGYHPVDGGMLLQVATRGGAAMQLVDALSGDTVEQLVMVPGALQALVVAGDGYVVLRTAALGTRAAGVGLDGTERWSILGPEPVLVGDRVVVRATPIEPADGVDTGAASPTLRLRAYGDAE